MKPYYYYAKIQINMIKKKKKIECTEYLIVGGRDTLDKGYTYQFLQDVTDKGRCCRAKRLFRHVRVPLFMPECLYEHANLNYYNT